MRAFFFERSYQLSGFSQNESLVRSFFDCNAPVPERYRKQPEAKRNLSFRPFSIQVHRGVSGILSKPKRKLIADG